MAYSLDIGIRYLRSKKRATISLITTISIAGVALGVAALLAVLSITSGFQQQFRDKVLGVNAHVLVLKYGLDFHEYREVIERCQEQPEVVGVGPFLINQMMLAKGDRLSTVLVKGVDPEAMVSVLDLPSQIIAGTLEGLRLEGAAPPLRPEDLRNPDLPYWRALMVPERDSTSDDAAADAGGGESASDVTSPSPPGTDEQPGAPLRSTSDGTSGTPAEPAPRATPLPGSVASPSAVEALLNGLDETDLALPDDDDAFIEVADDDLGDDAVTGPLPGLVIGATLAETMGIEVGDRVQLISPLSGSAVSSWSAPDEPRTPQSRPFRVIAIFQAGFQEYDSRLVYGDLFEVQAFLGQGDSVTGVEMRLRDLERSAAVARHLERTLEGPFHTMDWAELNRPLFTALELQKIMLSLVIATIIWVAAFNVIATLIMIVIEKKREIAILKAMGASDGTVLSIFMVQGTVIGLVGTIAGLALGGAIVTYLSTFRFALDPRVYLIDHLPVVVTASEFVLTAVIALGICMLSTLAPSWWAARMLPVEGLRHE
ncbi:MAG: FtsX-like permease family protein [Polyangiales bacterium]|nr:ABC transporter permease [Myxococcales bacterium]MCB9657920.1 ABC transporter permease [Sandaracinaceae bacterium]